MKIICAKNEINKKKLEGFTIGEASGTNKTFTFCTKTAFYGADFYSKAGLVVISSEGYAKSSLLDISTDIVQIAGRIRTKENPFRNVILHIYNTGIMCESRKEYEEKLNERLVSAEKTIEAYHNLRDDLKTVIVEKIRLDDPEEFACYNAEEKKVEIDKMKIAHAQYKFETIDNIYSNGISLREAYLKAGYDVEDENSWEQNIHNNIFFGMGESAFEILYKMYSVERKEHPVAMSDLAKDITMQNDIIPLAYNILGDEIVAELKYDELEIRNMIHFKSPETQAALQEELRITFKEGGRYSLKEIKNQLGLCFQKLRIGITAKASFIKQYFNVRKVKISDFGKRIDGFEILNKIFFTFGWKVKNAKF